MKNTIGKKVAGQTVVASQLLNSRGGRVMNDKGEIEASTTMDALRQMSEILSAMSNGTQIVTASEADKMEADKKKRQEVLSAMIADKSGETARAVGQEIAGTINTNLNRMGFMRQLMEYQELTQGQRPEVYVQDKNVTAAIMTGPTQAQLQTVKDPIVFPPEVDITGRLMIEGRVINVSREDILQRKYTEGLEQVLVQEDRMFKTGVDALVEATGQYSLHAGASVTPSMFESGMEMIMGYNMPPGAILFASSMFSNFITSRDFEGLIEPVSRLEILRTGRLGTIFGWAVMSDGTRERSQKVLDAGDIYYFSTPEFVGEYTDRGGVQSLPLTAAETGINGAGWHLNEYMSQVVANHRAVARTRLV